MTASQATKLRFIEAIPSLRAKTVPILRVVDRLLLSLLLSTICASTTRLVSLLARRFGQNSVWKTDSCVDPVYDTCKMHGSFREIGCAQFGGLFRWGLHIEIITRHIIQVKLSILCLRKRLFGSDLAGQSMPLESCTSSIVVRRFCSIFYIFRCSTEKGGLAQNPYK